MDDYSILRTTAGVYRPDAQPIRFRGPGRHELLDAVLSKGTDFADPESCRECLVLRPDGAPLAIVVHLELDDESWILARTPVAAEDLRAACAEVKPTAPVEIDVAPQGWGCVAVEGPQSWRTVTGFLDFDISGLALNMVVDFVAADRPGLLARIGTTGEYGYVVLGPDPDGIEREVRAAAEALGGGAVGPEALERVRCESAMPAYSLGFHGLSVVEADLAWLVDWSRIGEFRGSESMDSPSAEGPRVCAAVADGSTGPLAGDAVAVAGHDVGRVLSVAPPAGTERAAEILAFLLVDSPFWVPGVEFSATAPDGGEVVLRSVTLPRVRSRSLEVRIGE